MGNTNIPQAGAADVKNGRETLSGIDQLTDEQKAAEQKKRARREAERGAEIRAAGTHVEDAAKHHVGTRGSPSDAD